MSKFNFESLTVYQRAFTLSKNIYLLTQTWPREHLFGLTDQIRRASLSIVLNIAEGSSRTRKDYQHFLIIARGSCFECISLINLAFEIKLISLKQKEEMYNEIYQISKMLSGLRASLAKRK